MKLFASATLKLAGWYLLILMTVSLLFSVIVFQVARSEVETRIFQIMEARDLPFQYLMPDFVTPTEQLSKATTNLMVSLVYINLIVLLTGGAAAYWLAKHTLKPIEQAHQSQSRFVANASHQLRTPLSIMKAETELELNNKKSSIKSLKSTLSSNLEEINHLSKLSAMLLDLSQNQSTLEPSTDNIDIDKLIRDAVASHKIKNRASISVATGLQTISHETALREIVNVLIDNAIKHSSPKSAIGISATSQKNNILIEISNTGTISKKQLPHIFERFYKASDSKGYGLGLSVAKQLADSLGGHLEATSRAGETQFKLTLPNK